MKILQIREAFEEYSEKASDLGRNLCFAGIAVIWLLRTGTETGGIQFNNALIVPLYGYVIALSLDFLHYIYYTAVWGIANIILICRYKNENTNVPIWHIVHLLPAILFYGKLLTTAASYVCLLKYMACRINI